MRRLPNVDRLVAQITQRAAAQVELQKQASVSETEYIVPVARDLKKVAEICRVNAINVSVSDVEAFAKQLMR